MSQKNVHTSTSGHSDEHNELHSGITPTEQISVNGADDLLDEIDSLLESNAEEFVRSYVQKGGQ